MRRGWLLMIAALLSAGCVNLDGFVYNPIHCSQVGPSTCEEVPEGWDPDWSRTCTPCDQPYDWGIEYAWPEGMLAPGQTIRPIDPDTITHRRPTTEDGQGTLDVYFIPAHGEDPELADVTVVYNHGNFAGIEHYIPRVRLFHEAGYNTLVWDYRGYGKSQPDTPPTGAQFVADARQIRRLTDELAPDPARVLVYGVSLGGIPAVEMAADQGACALMLDAPFTSIHQIGETSAGVGLPESFLSQGHFENTEKITEYPGPVLGMVGSEDATFSPEDVRALVEASPGPHEVWVVEGAAHGIGEGVPDMGLDAYLERMRSFLSEHDACGL